MVTKSNKLQGYFLGRYRGLYWLSSRGLLLTRLFHPWILSPVQSPICRCSSPEAAVRQGVYVSLHSPVPFVNSRTHPRRRDGP